MKKHVLIFGSISGLIVSGLMVISMSMCMAPGSTFENGMIYGYAGMILAFSMIFVGIKNFRDKHNGGFISFGKAFMIGLYISLIASTMYVITWMVDNYFFLPDFGDKYAEFMVAQAKKDGATDAEIATKTAEMAKFIEMYKNPFFKAMMTYLEILPIGLLASLIAAAIFKKKPSVAEA
ncbi:MAG: DUF4199 domain-containing protein [Bacteroidia bacterium]|nr:DUF4199 domain-containing protein [Bacteroidia bacterium]